MRRFCACSVILALGVATALAGCGGSSGIGAGKSTLRATLTESAGVDYAPLPEMTGLSLAQVRQESVGFDNALVGGGEPTQGITFSMVPAAGGTTLTTISNESGQIGIGVVDKGDYRITLSGAEGNPQIRLPLIVEIVTALTAIVRVDEPTPGEYLVNMQVIGDDNGDGYSDDGYRLTITAQGPAGGGGIVLEHGTSTELPEELRGVREEGTLDAEGDYTLTPVTP